MKTSLEQEARDLLGRILELQARGKEVEREIAELKLKLYRERVKNTDLADKLRARTAGVKAP